MKNILLVLSIATVLTAQTTVNLPSLTVTADATTSINLAMRKLFSGTNTSATAPIADNGTTLTVASTAGIAANALLMIDDEVVLSSAKTATTFTITRAALGTVAAAHSSGAVVRELKYRSFAHLFMVHFVLAGVGDMMEQNPAGAFATQTSAITTSQAAKDALKAGAVQ